MQIDYQNVDEGIILATGELVSSGYQSESRNGPVLRIPEPVILSNEDPCNRVSLLACRDANPFFHLIEALWMLAGDNSLVPLLRYNPGMAQYSDDARTLRGTAYGHKWRTWFGYDQLNMAITRLREDPTDRRIVMTMWDPRAEWKDPKSKDLSCNLQVVFSVVKRKGVDELDMMVTNRSNDLIYGCLGSNVFHFSFILEFVALHAGLKPGRLHQVTANLHAYVENPVFQKVREAVCVVGVGVPDQRQQEFPTLTALELENDKYRITDFLYNNEAGESQYLNLVARPLVEAYKLFKLKTETGVTGDRTKILSAAISIAGECADVRLADGAMQWLGRRLQKEVAKGFPPYETPRTYYTIAKPEGDLVNKEPIGEDMDD